MYIEEMIFNVRKQLLLNYSNQTGSSLTIFSNYLPSPSIKHLITDEIRFGLARKKGRAMFFDLRKSPTKNTN